MNCLQTPMAHPEGCAMAYFIPDLPTLDNYEKVTVLAVQNGDAHAK
ncbi:hypothetical protein [Chitinophaga flava]|nr:hypothetical protein [Chitinophaga flava]